MTTQEYIQKEAENLTEKYKPNPFDLDYRDGFISGLSAGIELAKEFAEWVDAGFTMMDKGWTELWEVLDPSHYTTSELFELFLTERNEK